MKRLKQASDKILSMADLNKKYPDYFNKKIFRASFVLAFLFFFYTVLVAGSHTITGYTSITCPKDALTGVCFNPYAYCAYGSLQEKQGIICPDSVKLSKLCATSDLCSKKYLQRGETLGEIPPPIVKHAHIIVFLIIFMAFPINEINYLIKNKGGKKWHPPTLIVPKRRRRDE